MNFAVLDGVELGEVGGADDFVVGLEAWNADGGGHTETSHALVVFGDEVLPW